MGLIWTKTGPKFGLKMDQKQTTNEPTTTKYEPTTTKYELSLDQNLELKWTRKRPNWIKKDQKRTKNGPKMYQKWTKNGVKRDLNWTSTETKVQLSEECFDEAHCFA